MVHGCHERPDYRHGQCCKRDAQSFNSLNLCNPYQVKLHLKEAMILNIKEYTVGISSCGRSRDWIHGLALIDKMQRAGVTRDVISFSAAISACEKGSQCEQALALLGEMQEEGVTRNVISFSAAISACEKGSQ